MYFMSFNEFYNLLVGNKFFIQLVLNSNILILFEVVPMMVFITIVAHTIRVAVVSFMEMTRLSHPTLEEEMETKVLAKIKVHLHLSQLMRIRHLRKSVIILSDCWWRFTFVR